MPTTGAPAAVALHPSLPVAQAIVDTIRSHEGSDVALAIDVAIQATRAQAQTIGSPLVPVEIVDHASSSEALTALAAVHGVVLTPEQRASVLELDALDEPLAAALTGVVDAFIAFDLATAQAFEGVDVETLLDEAAGAAGAATITAYGVELGPVLAARIDLLEAVEVLYEATESLPQPRLSPVQVAPVFSISFGANDQYNVDYALLIDVGGNDQYYNNAGGSDLTGGSCNIANPTKGAAAALIDIGGNDQYISGRHCGANGGGFAGAGFLSDVGGNDRYTAGTDGTNGGGRFGTGFLLDADGNDHYTAGDRGTNGGGAAGAGLSVDVGGGDSYTAGSTGTNGGGVVGSGFLVDVGTDDVYTAGTLGTNGGSSIGSGVLIDAGSSATVHYHAGVVIQGTTVTPDAGVNVDSGGDDVYDADDGGTNGGSIGGGSGLLYDTGGDDSYTAGTGAVNGGGLAESIGLLIDGNGIDSFFDNDVGLCENLTTPDCSIIPKDDLGALVDGTTGASV